MWQKNNIYYVIFYLVIKMKVKIFDFEHEADLEDAINNFISDKKIIDIKYNISSSMYAEEQIYCYSALIIYN